MIIVLVMALLVASSNAAARDDGRWRNADPSLKAWIKSLTNKKRLPCCDTADGFPPEAVVAMGGDRYRVVIKGKTYDVPDYAVLSEPNRVGYPIVWYVHSIIGEITIVCFLPGAGG